MMRAINVSALVVFVMVSLWVCAFAQSQPSIEKRVQRVLLYESVEGENYSLRTEIAKIGNTDEVREVLLRMVMQYKRSKLGTIEFIYIYRAIWVLGEMQEECIRRSGRNMYIHPYCIRGVV